MESATPSGRGVPGPGTYPISSSLKNGSPSFTMRMRTPNPSLISTNRGIPGPGQYRSNSSFDPMGQLCNSKFKNNGFTLFSPSSSTRFKGYSDVLK